MVARPTAAVLSSAALALGAALVRGALAGVPTLGLLGRLAMAGFALSTGRPLHFTPGGTLTVLLYGGAVGAVIGLVVPLVRRRLPSGPLGGAALGALALALATPGIRPPWPRTFALFAPAFIAYGLLLARLWRNRK